MGLFKKIFRPIRKVLDKVVPNEIKPFLPYAAAAVPFLAPTSGIFGTMAGRAALAGGANIAAQLAQEGADDDINSPHTSTTKDHIKRDVEVKIAEMPPLGGSSEM